MKRNPAPRSNSVFSIDPETGSGSLCVRVADIVDAFTVAFGVGVTRALVVVVVVADDVLLLIP